ncbi:hypothetical protein KC19_6G106800 [Ceratodon purpureus]|uniref:Uncharacterized protein n=1 Tax=Ceratodon purpureus TaxID=3225 RepID=A0A8T0HFD1_CERPU|nr:hypothetical protein KC19_6G106800 [Ceratodon purpureus]
MAARWVYFMRTVLVAFCMMISVMFLMNCWNLTFTSFLMYRFSMEIDVFQRISNSCPPLAVFQCLWMNYMYYMDQCLKLIFSGLEDVLCVELLASSFVRH